MSLLEQIQSGNRPLVVSLHFFVCEKEYTSCATIDEAKSLLHRPMARGWQYRIADWQWGDGIDPYGAEVGEVERACGIIATCDQI